MNFELITANLLSPPVLFFALGMIAAWVKSDLDLPQPVPKVLSLYLLLAIGFKGGTELGESGLTHEVIVTVGAAMIMACAVPLYAFPVLRKKLDAPNAAAVAATYGSISAVTFIAATSFLAHIKAPYSGHMVAAMALMESPAIIAGVLLARKFGLAGGPSLHWGELFRDAFFNGSVLVLTGSLAIGAVTGASGEAALKPFTGDIFKGVLCLFLLDMGLVSARRLAAAKVLGAFEALFAVLFPLANAAVAFGICALFGIRGGDAFLLIVLGASASYIAVPAAMRLAVPEANPGLYVTMALAVTFPFNVAVGLPLYMGLVNTFLPAP